LGSQKKHAQKDGNCGKINILNNQKDTELMKWLANISHGYFVVSEDPSFLSHLSLSTRPIAISNSLKKRDFYYILIL
jgi:hypothetical protein